MARWGVAASRNVWSLQNAWVQRPEACGNAFIGRTRRQKLGRPTPRRASAGMSPLPLHLLSLNDACTAWEAAWFQWGYLQSCTERHRPPVATTQFCQPKGGVRATAHVPPAVGLPADVQLAGRAATRGYVGPVLDIILGCHQPGRRIASSRPSASSPQSASASSTPPSKRVPSRRRLLAHPRPPAHGREQDERTAPRPG